jgi:hypothetical protein
LYSPQRLVPFKGAFLLPPNYRALVDANTGQFVDLTAVSPADLGRADPEDKFLGVFNIPAGVTPEQYTADQARLYQLYDLLLPAFAAGRAAVPEQIKEAAAEFRGLFPRVAEPPLEPYYQAVGNAFFDWLARVAL